MKWKHETVQSILVADEASVKARLRRESTRRYIIA